MPKFPLDQIAKLYEFEPWQRELLEEMLRADEHGWREREAYRERVIGMVAEVERALLNILGLTGSNFDSKDT